MVEYGLILALVVLAVVVGVKVLGTHVVAMYQHSNHHINGAVG